MIFDSDVTLLESKSAEWCESSPLSNAFIISSRKNANVSGDPDQMTERWCLLSGPQGATTVNCLSNLQILSNLPIVRLSIC